MTERIKLTDLEFSYNCDKDYLRIEYPVDMNIQGEEFYNKIKQQILTDHEKINRFNQIFSNYKKYGSPTNIPELTGVDQGVIDQIQNIILHTLEYIEDGKVPDGYSTIKKIVAEK